MKTRIVEARKALKLTQKALAEKMNLSKNYISLMESGTFPVTDKFVRDFTRDFGVNEIWLRSGEGEMFAPMGKEQIIARISAGLLKEKPESFRLKLAMYIALCSDEDLKLIQDFCRKMTEEETEAE